MKVKEFVQKLQEFDQELDIVCYSEHEHLLLKTSSGSRLLDIIDVNKVTAKRVRLQDGSPCLQFGEDSTSQPILIVEVTPDF